VQNGLSPDWEKMTTGKAHHTGGKDEAIPSVWAELDKLKL